MDRHSVVEMPWRISSFWGLFLVTRDSTSKTATTNSLKSMETIVNVEVLTTDIRTQAGVRGRRLGLSTRHDSHCVCGCLKQGWGDARDKRLVDISHRWTRKAAILHYRKCVCVGGSRSLTSASEQVACKNHCVNVIFLNVGFPLKTLQIFPLRWDEVQIPYLNI